MKTINLSYKRVGGLRFVKIGRLTFSWSIAKEYKPFKAPANRSIEVCERAFRERSTAVYDRQELERTVVL